MLILVSFLIFTLGLWSLLLNRSSFLMAILCFEVMFYGINIGFIGFGYILNDAMSQIISIFILTSAALESALALALLMVFFKVFSNIIID